MQLCLSRSWRLPRQRSATLAVFDRLHETSYCLVGTCRRFAAEIAGLLLELLRGNTDAAERLDHRYASLVSVILLLSVGVVLLVREHPDWLELRRVLGPAVGPARQRKQAAVAFSWSAAVTAITIICLSMQMMGIPFAYGVMKLVQPSRCTELILTASMSKYYYSVRTSFLGADQDAKNAPTGALLSDLSSDPDEIHLLSRTNVNQLYLHKFRRQDVIGFLFTGASDCNAF